MTEVVEVRKVIIQYENRIMNDLGSQDARSSNSPTATPELVEAVRRELIRIGSRNPDIFGGRA